MPELKDFLEQIKNYRYSRLNPPIDTKQAILLQKELNDNGFASVPESFMQILHSSNGISYDSATILGTFTNNPLKDIVSQNIGFDTDKDTLILGLSEMDLLAYKMQEKKYQILDRYDAKILDEYDEKDIVQALSAFLKIRND